MGDTATELVRHDNPDLPVVGARTAAPALIETLDMQFLDALRERLEAFKKRLNRGEEPGEGDYGVFPGTDREVLYQKGGRKYEGFLQAIDRPKQMKSIENWEDGFFHYEFETAIVSRVTGQVLAIGVGSANSMESKWRYRLAERKCPTCGVAAILRSKVPDRKTPNDPPGWYCYKKRGGCGENFAHNDESITKQELGRVDNDDVQSQVNTILKIAKKRAFMDGIVAILAMCGFDIEAGDEDEERGGDAGDKGKRDTKGANGSSDDRVTEAEQKTLMETATKAGGHKLPDITKWLLEEHKVDLTKGRVPKALLATLTERLSKKEPLITPAGDGSKGESGKLGRGF